jgi:hypothetical protein
MVLLTDTQACYGVQKHLTSTFQCIKRIYTGTYLNVGGIPHTFSQLNKKALLPLFPLALPHVADTLNHGCHQQ